MPTFFPRLSLPAPCRNSCNVFKSVTTEITEGWMLWRTYCIQIECSPHGMQQVTWHRPHQKMAAEQWGLGGPNRPLRWTGREKRSERALLHHISGHHPQAVHRGIPVRHSSAGKDSQDCPFLPSLLFPNCPPWWMRTAMVLRPWKHRYEAWSCTLHLHFTPPAPCPVQQRV